MPIRFRCVYCDKLLGIARRKAGAVVNCPHCAEKLIVPTPEPEESDAPSHDESAGIDEVKAAGVSVGEKPRPLFEQADFSALLHDKPTFRMNESATAAPNPMASTARHWEQAEPKPAPPLFHQPQPGPVLTAPPFIHEEAPRPPGYFLSPSKATWLSVLVVVLLALAFAGGLLVGQSMKG